jgi:hypothetical protein
MVTLFTYRINLRIILRLQLHTCYYQYIIFPALILNHSAYLFSTFPFFTVLLQRLLRYNSHYIKLHFFQLFLHDDHTDCEIIHLSCRELRSLDLCDFILETLVVQHLKYSYLAKYPGTLLKSLC